MSDFSTFTAMLTGAELSFERLDIYDGDVEISKAVEDMLNMRNVKIVFRFSRDGELKWIDAETS